MNHRPSLPSTGVELPDSDLVVDGAYAAYFALLVLAPLALPPLLADAGSRTYAEALLGVLPVAGVGYVAGLAALLRTA